MTDKPLDRPDMLVTGGSLTEPPRPPGMNPKPFPVVGCLLFWVGMSVIGWGMFLLAVAKIKGWW